MQTQEVDMISAKDRAMVCSTLSNAIASLFGGRGRVSVIEGDDSTFDVDMQFDIGSYHFRIAEEKRKIALKTIKGELEEAVVVYTAYVPVTRYSGNRLEPDYTDEEEVACSRNVEQAACEALLAYFRDVVYACMSQADLQMEEEQV